MSVDSAFNQAEAESLPQTMDDKEITLQQTG